MITLGYQYCYLDCKSTKDLVFMLFNTLLTIAITAYAAKNILKARNTRDYSRNKFLYILMLVWGVVFTTCQIFAMTVYVSITLLDGQWRMKITEYSRYYTIMRGATSVSILLLQSFIARDVILGANFLLSKQGIQIERYEFTIYRFIKSYGKYRFVPMVPLLLVFLIPGLHPTLYDFFQQIDRRIIYLIIDSGMCGLLLFYARAYLVKKSNILQNTVGVTVNRLSLLLLQMNLLILSAIARFILFFPPFFMIPDQSVLNQQQGGYPTIRCIQSNPTSYYFSFTLFFGIWGMDFLPLMVASTMYHPDQRRLKASVTEIEASTIVF